MTESQTYMLIFLLDSNSQLLWDLNEMLTPSPDDQGNQPPRPTPQQFQQAFQAKLSGEPFNLNPPAPALERLQALYMNGPVLLPRIDNSVPTISAAFSFNANIVYSPGPCPHGVIVHQGPDSDVQARLWKKFTAE